MKAPMNTRHYIVVWALMLMGIGGGASAQTAQAWEFGFWGGFTNYFGDLNSKGSFEFIGPGTGIFMRYNMSTRFAYKVGANYGRVSFDDAASPFDFQVARNLSFESDIIEFTNHIEFNFFKYDKSKDDLRFTPYLLAGVSVFYFNPKAEINGEKVTLRSLGTEGQELDGRYKRISIAVPLGGGFKYSFTSFWTLSIEGGYRKTFTDYIDDVSTTFPGRDNVSAETAPLSDRSGEVGDAFGSKGKQRGDSLRNDDYLYVGVGLSYTLIKVKCPKISRIP